MTNQVIHGDCMDVLAEMPDNCIDTIITDPPYHLGSISKRFTKTSLGDNNNTAANARNGSNQYARLSTGFMGARWDGGGIAFQPELWAEMLRVAKPGAMLLAFGGTRTHHRLMVAIEDAGWEIRDVIMYLFGSGFPKSHNISKAIDKTAIIDCANCNGKGFVMPELPSYEELVAEDPDNHITYEDWLYFQTPEGIIARQYKCADCNGTGKVKGKHGTYGEPKSPAHAGWIDRGRMRGENGHEGLQRPWMQDKEAVERNARKYIPATEAAKTWEGYGTGLKPAYEPLIYAQKPLTVVPFDDIITETNVLIGGALCLLLSSVNDAEKILKLNQVDSNGKMFVSVACLVGLLSGAKSGELHEKMDMFNSPETVLMCLNIATLWNNILGEVLKPGNTFTIKTETEVTIGLKTLRYLLLTIIPESIIQDVSQADGPWQNVNNAENNLAAEKMKPDNIQRRFAAVIATWKTGENGTLANIAANNLRQIIPSVNTALLDVLISTATESDQIESNEIASNAEKNLKQSPQDQQGIVTENVWQNITPAYEPIILAMKPIEKNYANNALIHGVAGLNIDGARIGTDGRPLLIAHNEKSVSTYGDGLGGSHAAGITCQGRWPANVLMSHSAGCVRRGEKQVKTNVGWSEKDRGVSTEPIFEGGLKERSTNSPMTYADPNGLETVADWICVEDCAVRLLDEQAKTNSPKNTKPVKVGASDYNASSYKAGTHGFIRNFYADSGSASRFFYTAKAPNREKWFYCQLCQAAYPNKERDNHGHDIDQGQRKHIVAHPTVKPLEIAKYLCKLTRTPTGGIVLDPFAGSGTTALACIEMGRDFILIEKEADYYEIAKARVEAAMSEPRQAELF